MFYVPILIIENENLYFFLRMGKMDWLLNFSFPLQMRGILFPAVQHLHRKYSVLMQFVSVLTCVHSQTIYCSLSSTFPSNQDRWGRRKNPIVKLRSQSGTNKSQRFSPYVHVRISLISMGPWQTDKLQPEQNSFRKIFILPAWNCTVRKGRWSEKCR